MHVYSAAMLCSASKLYFCAFDRRGTFFYYSFIGKPSLCLIIFHASDRTHSKNNFSSLCLIKVKSLCARCGEIIANNSLNAQFFSDTFIRYEDQPHIRGNKMAILCDASISHVMFTFTIFNILYSIHTDSSQCKLIHMHREIVNKPLDNGMAWYDIQSNNNEIN